MTQLLDNNGEKGKPLWVMIHSKIYDVTRFKHPGGRSLLINDDDNQYDDKGIEFDSVNHSKEALEELGRMFIGELSDEVSKENKTITSDATIRKEKVKVEREIENEDKKDYIVELQPVTNTFNKDDEVNKNDHFRAFMLTCIIVFLILLLIINF